MILLRVRQTKLCRRSISNRETRPILPNQAFIYPQSPKIIIQRAPLEVAPPAFFPRHCSYRVSRPPPRECNGTTHSFVEVPLLSSSIFEPNQPKRTTEALRSPRRLGSQAIR